MFIDEGSLEDAEQLIKQAMLIWENAFGSQNPNVATALNNLGEVYRLRGSYNESEAFYKRALSIRKAILKLDHPDIAQSLFNLALMYKAEKRYLDAIQSVKGSIEILTKVRSRHPDLSKSEELYDELKSLTK